MAQPFPPPPPAAPPSSCYRHPHNPAGVACQRCGRLICPQCMHTASVGFHCPECLKQGKQKVYQGTANLPGTRPVLTLTLIGINVAVFVLGILLSGTRGVDGASELTIDYGLVSRGLTNGGQLVGVGEGEWYRIITSGFLHYGVFHLAMNMYALWVLGQVLEPAIGRLRMGLVYGVSLVGGSFGALLLSPFSLTVGASGAIFGLMGAFVALGRARGIPIRNSPIIGVLVLNVVITFALSSFISVGGHMGGLIGGFLAGTLILEVPSRLRRSAGAPPGRPKASDPNELVVLALCGLLGLALFVAAIAVGTNPIR